MKPIKVLVTATGCPGASTFLRQLQNEVKERRINIVATDMSSESVGRFLAPVFYKVPAASSVDYIQTIKRIVKCEKPDVLYCVSSYEVPVIAQYKNDLEQLGTRVIVCSSEAAEIAGDKFKLYSALENIPGIHVPRFFSPKNLEEFIGYAKVLGYPQKRVCFKPHVSKGSRGYRVIDDSISRRDLLMNYKPESLFISMKEFVCIFENEPDFPSFLIMEYIEGEEIDAMVLAKDGEMLLTTCKTRESVRGGVIMTGELVDRPEIVSTCQAIINQIPIDYNSGIQFKGGCLIEINPRVSTFIYEKNLIEPYLTIKLALGEISKEELKALQKKIPLGRRMIRYMDQVFYDKQGQCNVWR